jgi:hypothetical protein
MEFLLVILVFQRFNKVSQEALCEYKMYVNFPHNYTSVLYKNPKGIKYSMGK